MAGFILQVNTLRALVARGVLDRDEASDLVEEARHQLNQLIGANQADGADMLDRELLDYEAIFRNIDNRAADDLLRTLREALDQILEADAAAYEEMDGGLDDIVVDLPEDGLAVDPTDEDGLVFGQPVDRVRDPG